MRKHYLPESPGVALAGVRDSDKLRLACFQVVSVREGSGSPGPSLFVRREPPAGRVARGSHGRVGGYASVLVRRIAGGGGVFLLRQEQTGASSQR